MRASSAAFLLLAAAALTGGCKKKEYQAQCPTTISALGVGFDNVDIPMDEARRKAQVDRMGMAIDAWNASKDKVTLTDLRQSADALSAVVVQRKTLLGNAKFVAAPAPPPPASSAEARQA